MLLQSDQDNLILKTMPMFGSQRVDKNSPTPYSDATQVRRYIVFK